LINAATDAVRAVWTAHAQLTAFYEKRHHSATLLSIRAQGLSPGLASTQAALEICWAVEPIGPEDIERSEALNDAVMALLEWPTLQLAAATEVTP
jgi:hypothetical protein